jgi:hypothetical protein
MMPTIEDRVAALEADQPPSHAELARRMSQFVDKVTLRDREMFDWLGGTPDGGPNQDGFYPMTDMGGFVRQIQCPAAIALMAQSFRVVTRAGVASLTLVAADLFTLQRVTNGTATANINVRLPNVPVGAQVMFEQLGTGKLNFTSSGGTDFIRHRQTFTRTAGQNAVAGATCTAFSGGVSTWTLFGDLML